MQTFKSAVAVSASKICKFDTVYTTVRTHLQIPQYILALSRFSGRSSRVSVVRRAHDEIRRTVSYAKGAFLYSEI